MGSVEWGHALLDYPVQTRLAEKDDSSAVEEGRLREANGLMII